MSCESSGLLWPHDRLLPEFQPVEHLTVYDLRGASRDFQLAATVIAGIVNCPRPSIYLLFGPDEEFWLQRLPAAIPVTYASETGEAAFYLLLAAAHSQLHGLIIYDPVLPDTINVATSLAAQHNAVVVSPALADACMQRYEFPVLNDLRTYHWQSRLQAYHWAQQNVLPDASCHLIAGLDPQNFCALRSFLVATRSFCYWLDSREYLPPLRQRLLAGLSERRLLTQILRSLVPGAAHMGWVVHEQSGVALASSLGIPVVASDYVANLEVWIAVSVHMTAITQVQTEHAVAAILPQVEPTAADARPRAEFAENIQSQTEPVSVGDWSSSALQTGSERKRKIYLSFTMSDGDNLQYCQHRLLKLWQDEARGSVPIGWTLTPLLSQCMPTMADYYINTATHNDEFLCSPSGLAYMYPSRWPRQRLAHYVEQSATAMEQIGMNTIEIFDTACAFGAGLPLLRAFSLTGMGMHKRRVQDTITAIMGVHGVHNILSGLGYTGLPGRTTIVNDVVIYHNPGYSDTVAHTVQLIKAASALTWQRPLYLNIYLLAWTMTPSAIKEVLAQLGPDYVCVLPSMLLSLLAAEKHMR
jgi:hypothetical protein